MKNVLITGGSGLAGSFIIRKLLEEGFSVQALLRSESNTKNLSDVLDRIGIVQGNILDIVALDEAMKGMDYVVHAAALVSYDPADHKKIFKTNVEGTANVVNVALGHPIKKLCHLSSVAALGKAAEEGAAVDENTPRQDDRGEAFYARSKYLAEKEVWRGICEGLPAVILNPSVILGPGDTEKSSTRLFGHVLKNKTYYPSGKFNYIDVRDLADIAFRSLISDVCGERFIVSAGTVSYEEFFRKTAEHLNRKIPKFEISYQLARFLEKADRLRAFLFGGSRILTRETTETLRGNTTYDNSKTKRFFEAGFRTLDDTLPWTCSCLQDI